MIRTIGSLWRMLNQTADDQEKNQPVSDRGATLRLARCYLRPFWPSLLVVFILSSVSGLSFYGYALATRVIADQIVQVQLLAPDHAAAPLIGGSGPDPGRFEDQVLFRIQDPPRRDSLEPRVLAQPGRSLHDKLGLLGVVAALLLAMELVRLFAGFISKERLIHVGQKVQFRLRQNLHDKLTSLPVAYHDRHSPGKLLTHLFSDVAVVRGQFAMLVLTAPLAVLKFFVGVLIVLAVDAKLAGMVLLGVPTYGVFYRWFRVRFKVVNTNLRDREGQLNGHIANRVGNFLLVKAFVRETRETIGFLRKTRPLMRDWLSLSLLNTVFGAVCGITTGMCMTAVLWLGALRVRDGHMTLGDLLLFYAAAGQLFSPVASLTQMTARWHRLRTVAGRIMRVLDEQIVLADPPEPLRMPDHPCELRFEHATMRYAPDLSPALNDVSFVLSAGERLCIMGPSGGGKSTLAKLVCRLYDPTSGAVLFDDMDIRLFRAADLRRHVCLVTQEPVVFSGTIADNIAYGTDQDDPDALATAAGHAQIDDFIGQLPREYRTLTAERGLTLSGGQKQRLTLARALMSDPRMLVLDDCTSALDADTEAMLLDGFRDALSDRTVVIVSHRISFAMACDKVLMLEDGRATQFGSPEALIDQSGPFADLVRQQQDRAWGAGVRRQCSVDGSQ